MATVVYPLPLNKQLARQVTHGAKATGLSQAELMRQALAFGLPRVIEALRKSQGRLTSVDPLPEKTAKALYRLADDDREQVGRLSKSQDFRVND